MMEDLRRCPFQHDGTVYYWGDQSRTQYIPILVAPELAGTHMTITNTLPKLVDPLVPLPINGFNTEFMTGTLGVKDMGSFPHELVANGRKDARTCDQQRTNRWRRAAPSIQPKQ
ncbi:hypothetical protein IWQ56_005283 [Coemansia nantahalensis]|nr:hypothetical protein IWQ56_005283 [Coemansia nantahalensis]